MQKATRSREGGELWTMHDVLACDVCGCVQDKDWGVIRRAASELGHNSIKNTDGIIWPEFVERTQTDRKT